MFVLLLNSIVFAEVKTMTVQFKSGSETVSAYLAVPEGKGKHPALIVIHEWWGLNDWIKDNAKMFAQNGYVALAVDLYRGKVATDKDTAHELSRGLPEDQALRDLKAAFSYLKSRKDVNAKKIGVIGWCMGGGYSLQTAIAIPELSASVIAYGRLVTDAALVKKIKAPVLGIFGALDKGISVDSVRAFEKRMKDNKKRIQIHIYDEAGHAFMNPNNTSGYNKDKANEAWSVIFTFLEKNLTP